MLINWKRQFESHIRDRGYGYAIDHLVTMMHEEDHRIEAQVSGTMSYDVVIEYDFHRVTGMACTCPYAVKGRNCKHMAAVLYVLELEEAAQLTKDLVNDGRREEEANPRADKETVEDLIALYAQDEEEWNRYDGYDDYDGYEAYDPFMLNQDLNRWLQAEVPSRLTAHHVLSAFSAIREVWMQVADLNEYDEYDDVLGVCLSYFDEILKQMTPEQERPIFDWLLEWTEATGDVPLTNLLMTHFQSEEDTKRKLAVFDRRIAHDTRHPNQDYHDVSLAQDVRHRITLMTQLGATPAEVAVFRSHYRYVRDIQEDELADILKQDPDTAIQLIQDMQATLPEEKRQAYAEKLLTLYKQVNRLQAYQELLYHIIFTYPQRDTKHLLAYKEYCTAEEWEDTLNRVEQSHTTWVVYEELLVQTKAYDRLMDRLERLKDIQRVDRYELLLKKRYPQRLRNLYTWHVVDAFPYCKTKREYQEIVRYLKKMMQYDGGRTMVDKVLSDWRAEFPRRRLFWAEVEKERV